MATPKTNTDATDAVTDMLSRMSACTTIKDLIDLAGGKDFDRVYTDASESDQRTLRDHYDALRATLQHRVRLQDIKDQTVTVFSADIKDTVHGTAVVLKGTRKDGQPFSVITSGKAVVRHFSAHWDKLPAEYVFAQRDVHPDDPTMNPMWEAKRVPTSQRTRLPWDAA
jgi:hypothetical protein